MRSLIVVDTPGRWPLRIPNTEVVAARDYIADQAFADGPGSKIFNLCRSYRYQSAGYYVSLLAEARQHRPLPSITTIQDLRLASVVRLTGQDLSQLVATSLRRLRSERFELSIYFGRNLSASYDKLSLALFNAFPAPFLRATFEAKPDWILTSLRLIGSAEIPEAHLDFVVEQAQRYLKRAPRKPRARKEARFDLAILHDPEEQLPPSDQGGLRHFLEAGDSLGIRCELIRKEAYGRLAEFDGLFIRETTAVNHHTYRFSCRARAEGLFVIDDPISIVRCTNKVYLAETLHRQRLPTPRTITFSSDTKERVGLEIGFPCVLKQPDSSFSAGVTCVESPEEFDKATASLFKSTDLLVAQEFVPTEFDWRVGVLDGQPLYACRYHMAKGHWQILKRDETGIQEGDSDTIPVGQTPREVVHLAVRAANLIGDGLYGVDLKTTGGRTVIIEVNDNPSIDEGVEDQVLGEHLYLDIMRHFLAKFEQRRQ
jgi:glutathione synthase/RimK-type ligase-like ATP-grasp enzyme